RLPVARAVWTCLPDFASATGVWMRAGGAHHTVFSYGATVEMLEDFARIAGIECVVIGPDLNLRAARHCLG
ncbi:MAG: L-arabinose isomerase, partial [Terrimicrobiaceae bacterium]|nr:L-arabinose isomerase [Terrimicrobiaceae bacterium]